MPSTTQAWAMTAARRPTLHPVWVGINSIHKIYIQDLMFNMLLIYTIRLFESTGKQKQGKANSRKSKSPNLGQAYSGGERPSSVSSVHSEGDYHRQAQAQPQWSWDDRPSSTGEPPCLCCLKTVSCKIKVRNTWIQFINISFLSLLFLCPGSMQFPYNPLTMRILSNTPPTSIASPAIQSQQQQQQQPPPAGAPVAQQRVWQSLLSEQYETLSDSDD